jgi:hypothetical protein
MSLMTCDMPLSAAYRRCNWEDFDGREEFLDEVRRKGEKLGKIMIYEKKKKMRKKIFEGATRLDSWDN